MRKMAVLKSYPAGLPLADSTPYWSSEIQKLSGGSGCWERVASALTVQFRLTLGARGSRPGGHASPRVSRSDPHEPPLPHP